jgi:hypothetical protein
MKTVIHISEELQYPETVENGISESHNHAVGAKYFLFPDCHFVSRLLKYESDKRTVCERVSFRWSTRLVPDKQLNSHALFYFPSYCC